MEIKVKDSTRIIEYVHCTLSCKLPMRVGGCGHMAEITLKAKELLRGLDDNYYACCGIA